MRTPLPSSATPSAKSDSLPAPTGGWNARDPLANMKRTDAVFLDNFFPTASDVMLRKGSAIFATLPADTEPASPHNVRSLLSYQSEGGAAKLFAGCEDGLYNITAGGTVAAVSSACTNGSWESVNISTAGGSFLWCCNGVDKSRYYDGSAWLVLDGASVPALTGITSANVTNVSLFKSRLYLCEKDSLSFWYLPVNSVAGLAAEFPLGALFRRGGYLLATGAWTLDGGNGPEDYFIAVTSEGEVAVYAGTDPASAATWVLKGVYYVGTPMSRRCLMKLGGDVALLTVQGLYPLSRALLSSTVDRRSSISDKISSAWTFYTQQYGTLYGWQSTLFSEASMLLVNVPIVSQQSDGIVYSYQFVMNTQTGAWCRFLGMNSEVWAVHDRELYFANHNKVYKAWIGEDDSGGLISAQAKQAFFYPAGRGSTSFLTLIRPVVTANASVKLNLGIDTDYAEAPIGTSLTTYAQQQALWDTAVWDEAYWSLDTTIAKWRSVAHKPGRAVAFRLRLNGKGVSMTWVASDFIMQKGGMF